MRVRIDVHAHMTFPDYNELLVAGGVTLPGYSAGQPASAPVAASAIGGDPAAVAQRIELMDLAGVQRQALSPTVGPYLADADQAIAAARVINDRHANIIGQHPDRFAAFTALPLPHVDPAIAELHRGLDELGLLGAATHCSLLGRSMADPTFDPLFAALDQRAAVLFLHPAVNGACSPLVTDWGLSPTAGTIFEDTLAALHLTIRRIPERFPRIRIIVPHLGGALPMLLNRLDNQLSMSVSGLSEPPSRTLRRFWYDTVGHGSAAALRAAAEAFGADRLIAGSDYPVMLAFSNYRETFDQISKAGLPECDLERILQTNARDLFPSE